MRGKNVGVGVWRVFLGMRVVRLFGGGFGGRKINAKGGKEVEEREIVRIKRKIRL